MYATNFIWEEAIEEFTAVALPEEVRGHHMEGAGIIDPHATDGNQHRDWHRDDQIDREGEAETLDTNLACKLTCKHKILR